MNVRYVIRCAGCGAEGTAERYVGPHQYGLCPACENGGNHPSPEAFRADAPYLPADPSGN